MERGRPEAERRGAGHGDALLRVEDLSVSYGRIVALQPISFTAARGGLVLVLGPNGAGKTTLVKALAGAVALCSGRVWLDQDDVTRVPAYQRVRRGMALVPEGDKLVLAVRRWSVFGIPLPMALGPRSDTSEYVADGRFHFDVKLSHPLAGRIVHYRGWLERAVMPAAEPVALLSADA